MGLLLSPANWTSTRNKLAKRSIGRMYYAETWTRLKVDQKYVKVLTCGAGEGWRRSVGPIV